MTNAQYIMTSRALIKLSEVISVLDLEAFIETIEEAKKSPQPADPAFLEAAMARVEKTEKLARAALAIKQARAEQRGDNEAINASNRTAAEGFLMQIMG